MNTTKQRKGAVYAAIVAVAALLTGCMRMDVALTINTDDTVSGEFIVAFSDEAAEAMGMQPGDLMDQMGSDVTGDIPDNATVEPYAEDGYTGQRFTVEGTSFEVLDSPDMSITHEGSNYVFSGVLDLSASDTDTASIPPGLLDSFDVSVSVTFPYGVSDANGEIDGNTVTWTPAFGEVVDMSATGPDSDTGLGGGGMGPVLWIIIGIVAVLLIVLAIVLVLRSRKKKALDAPQNTAPLGQVPPTGAAQGMTQPPHPQGPQVPQAPQQYAPYQQRQAPQPPYQQPPTQQAPYQQPPTQAPNQQPPSNPSQP